MKVSVSLPADDVRFLDDFATACGSTRSAVLQQAVALLKSRQLGTAYVGAWDEWDRGDGRAWKATSGDGLEAA